MLYESITKMIGKVRVPSISPKSRQIWTIFLFLFFFVLILMRLVWLQLRDFETKFDLRGGYAVAALTQPNCFEQTAVTIIQPSAIKGVQALLAPQKLHYSGASYFPQLLHFVCNHFPENAPRWTLRAEMVLLFICVFICALLVRLLCRNWLLAMIAASVILSRGRLMSQIAIISPDALMMFFTSAWCLCVVHFFRSGSWFMFGAVQVVVVLAAGLEPIALALFGPLPCLILLGHGVSPYLKRSLLFRAQVEKHKERLGKPNAPLASPGLGGILQALFVNVMGVLLGEFPNEASSGNKVRRNVQDEYVKEKPSAILSAMRQPFAFWVLAQRRWAYIVMTSACLSLSALLLWSIVFKVDQRIFNSTFVYHFFTQSGAWGPMLACIPAGWDLHLIASVILVLICALQSPRKGILSYFEYCWLILATILCLYLGALLFTQLRLALEGLAPASEVFLQLQYERVYAVSLWLEPVLLTLGVVSIYQLVFLDRRAVAH